MSDVFYSSITYSVCIAAGH